MNKQFCGELLCYDVQQTLNNFYEILTEEATIIKNNKNIFDRLFNESLREFEDLIRKYKSVEPNTQKDTDFIDDFYQSSNLIGNIIKIENELKGLNNKNANKKSSQEVVVTWACEKIKKMVHNTCEEITAFINKLE